MKKKKETENQLVCEFCEQKFTSETWFFKHVCKYKQRYLNKDLQSNRIAYQAWVDYYRKNFPQTKKTQYTDFIKNSLYEAFARFGNYCTEAKVINTPRYLDWLVKHNIRIDNWNSDTNYTKFLIEYLRVEDPYDAIHRSVETLFDLAETEEILGKDYLKYGNTNKICYNITTGKISPWILYQSKTGTHFLETINPDHVKLIFDYINPELWAIKFNKNKEIVKEVKELVSKIGF